MGKIAVDQALGFLVGIGLIAVVQPTTSGGALLLILLAVATTNVIRQITRVVHRSIKNSDKPQRVGQIKDDWD
jgi:hypothetical protein